MNLADLVRHAAARTPDGVAVSGPGGVITYGALDLLANRFAALLLERGVDRGDRVAIWLDKSVDAVAMMQAALRLGAAYVPIDPLAPTPRVRMILTDCDVRAVVTTKRRAEAVLTDDLSRLPSICLDSERRRLHGDDVVSRSDAPPDRLPPSGDDLAYILFTSGSTGTPKGVCITHRSALAFIDWAAAELAATAADRFANHASLHFDLSVLDLYVAFRTGAAVHLIPDALSQAPRWLVAFIAREQITIWYSVPSALVLMMEHGGLLDHPVTSLRAILFAGEPFPVRHFRRLQSRWSFTRFLNLYGPTETNVCTFYEVREPLPDDATSIPIGRACPGNSVWAVDDDGRRVRPGERGELIVSGPSVMRGYWGHPPRGDEPYATGDIVLLQEEGNYAFIGRRDGMVKVRGQRMELGEIEAALVQHTGVQEAAVVVAGSGLEARLIAFVVSNSDVPHSLLEFKRHCAERLPRAMIVDEVRFVPALPHTRNGKVDRQQLKALVESEQSVMHRAEVMNELLVYIRGNIFGGRDIGLDASTPLLEWGVINSLELVKLVSFIEKHLGVAVPDDRILGENFKDLASITDLVLELAAGRRLGQGRPSGPHAGAGATEREG